MSTRRDFLINSSLLTAGAAILPSFRLLEDKLSDNLGIQLYTFREEMSKDAIKTLKTIADIGFKQIETARSSKGHYYGLTAKEMKKTCEDLGMTLRSGHVHLDDQFENTLQEAVESGQEYLICSSMPSRGQTVDNYKSVAEKFNMAGEACKKAGVKFGYHNHAYEFESDKGKVLYDILLEETEPELVHMELDLGWVIVGGKDPIDYFNRFSGRFPLWHLKDMDMNKKSSTEFGKGGLDIALMLKNKEKSGVKFIFVEQEEYASSPLNSMKQNVAYLEKM